MHAKILQMVLPLQASLFLLFVSSLVVSGVIFLHGYAGFSAPQFSLLALDPVEELQKQIDELEELKKKSQEATVPLQSELQNLNARVIAAQQGIEKAQAQSVQVSKNIDQREADLAIQYMILSRRIAEQYKRHRVQSPLLIFLSSTNAAKFTQDLAYRSSIEAQDNRLITELSQEIEQLEADRNRLKSDQERLAALQIQLNEQATYFRGEIAKAQEYQQELTGKIAELSAQQQAILDARSGTFTTAIGEVPPADDFAASIAFMAQAPSNSFAVFSFGAYTHRNGMSQYGAKARADSGQSVEEILKAYYPNATLRKDYPVPDNITVDGVGTIPFEDHYLHGIFEVPNSWHITVLKAQAIAARTYAIRRTNGGQSSICTTEACQVFRNQRKGGAWEKAVNETRNWVLVDNDGNPVSTQYASTHGGYSNTSGWDTTDKSGDGEWTTRAWDRKANSPWFYKAWYRSGYSSQGPNCGRNHPWLSQEDFSDIVNAWIVRRNPNGADTNRIQPVTINECNIGGRGGNPYSKQEMRNLANNSGGAVTSVSSVSVSHSSQGQTASVTLQTNRGTIQIPGNEFKTTFNLRAPGYIAIPQSSFAFFNIEHKK